MRAVLASSVAIGSIAGVAAQTAADCTNNWTSACEGHADYQVHPRLQLLPECTSNEHCERQGLTGCGYNELSYTIDTAGDVVIGAATGRNMWLTADGNLRSEIKNKFYDKHAEPTYTNTCGTISQLAAYMDPLKPISQAQLDGTTTTTQKFTGCLNPDLSDAERGDLSNYPSTRLSSLFSSCYIAPPTGQNSAASDTDYGVSKARPQCRCRVSTRTSSNSDCKYLFDAAQSSSTQFEANRLRAFQHVHQCAHYTAPVCTSKNYCRYAGPNINKQCSSDSQCNTNFLSECPTTECSAPVSGVGVDTDLQPGSEKERCTCDSKQCDDLWVDRDTAYTALQRIAEDQRATSTEQATLTRLDSEMDRLNRAGQCLRTVHTTTTPKPEYSMHIGLIAGIAAGSVALAAILTSALICILMYACRSESHQEMSNRNQRVLGGGQSAMVYGRSGHEMEMTRRSRY